MPGSPEPLFAVVLLNWALLLLAIYGVYRHLWNLRVLRVECRACVGEADALLCRHYLRHEKARLAVKAGMLILACYFLSRPILVVDPVLGIWGPIFVRLVLLGMTLILGWESRQSVQDRARLSRIVVEKPISTEDAQL